MFKIIISIDNKPLFVYNILTKRTNVALKLCGVLAMNRVMYSDYAMVRERVILHCDLNNYFASVELLDKPQLRNMPVIVGGSTAERHGIVLAKNYPAKSLGIMTGESVSTARGKCPSLVVLEPHYDKYLDYSRRVREIYKRYTCLVEAMGIDECFLDVTDSGYLFGSGERIANEIRESVKAETGLTISVGVSFNKIFAKLGSDMKKPDAVTVISREDFRSKIWGLPAYEMLGVGMKTYKKLWERSVRTIGDIAQCEPERLRTYLGKFGQMLWVYANGYENSPVMEENERCPIKSVGHGTTTVTDLDTEREVFDTIIELSQEIGAKLRKNRLKSCGVAVGIRENDLVSREYQMKFSSPTQLTRDIAKGAMKVFREKHVWRCPIRSVTVRAIYISSEDAPEQLGMFDENEYKQELLVLEKTVDRIRETYGEHSITSGSYLRNKKLNPKRIGFGDHSEIY